MAHLFIFNKKKQRTNGLGNFILDKILSKWNTTEAEKNVIIKVQYFNKKQQKKYLKTRKTDKSLNLKIKR